MEHATMSPNLQEELLQRMARLPEEAQQRVLTFVKGLTPAVGGSSGKDLLRFSGAIDHTDLQMIAKAIEEGCERVDRSEW
jgi:hypothetical protein